MDKFKKILLVALSAFCLIASTLPVYANEVYDCSRKVSEATLDDDYAYNLTIDGDGKLCIDGVWRMRDDPTKFYTQLQIVSPITHTYGWNFLDDGTVSVGYSTLLPLDIHYGLTQEIPVIRSVDCKGADKISMQMDLSGIPEGIYVFQEVITDGQQHKKGNYNNYMLLTMHNGEISLQKAWQYASWSSWWYKGDWSHDIMHIR